MVAIRLQTLWLSSAADLSDSISFPLLAKLNIVRSAPGEVRRMANGRLRAVRRAGTSRTVDVGLPTLTPTQAAWLDSHVGQLLLIRDDRGRKLYGEYFTVPDEAHQYDQESDSSLTLLEVSHDEAIT